MPPHRLSFEPRIPELAIQPTRPYSSRVMTRFSKRDRKRLIKLCALDGCGTLSEAIRRAVLFRMEYLESLK